MLVGVDEAGRGAWAGPLVAAALVVENEKFFPRRLVKDSKLLSDAARRRLFVELTKSCLIRFGIVSHRLIDRIGIQSANVLAVDLAVQFFLDTECVIHSDYIGSFIKLTSLVRPITLHIRGEAKFPEIAAASIAAKVFHDDLMIRLHDVHPVYNFAKHKGYGTEEHRREIKKNGLSAAHRRSFALAS